MRYNRVNETLINGHNPDYLSVQVLDTSIVEQSCGAETENAANHGRSEAKL